MQQRSRIALALAMGFAALAESAGACQADALDAMLFGSWTTTAADCARLFAGRAFRQPIDKFAQATIIEPGRIVTPSNDCRIQSVSHDAGVVKLTAECNDSISFTPQTAQIKIKSGGEIVYSPTGDPALDTTLVKCR
jgi:hypothetical protein